MVVPGSVNKTFKLSKFITPLVAHNRAHMSSERLCKAHYPWRLECYKRYYRCTQTHVESCVRLHTHELTSSGVTGTLRSLREGEL